MQNVNNRRASNRLRVIDARVLESRYGPQLLHSLVGQHKHVVFRSKVETSRRTRLDAGGFKSLPYAVGTQRALVDFFRIRTELRHVERTSGNAELTADAILLLKIDDAILVLHDGAVGGARGEAPWISAVHALVLAHQPLERAIFIRDFVELDQVPVIPVRVGHGLIRVVEHGGLERHVVPLHAGHFARFATNAGRRVDELADLFLALHTRARNRPGMTRNFLYLQRLAIAHLLTRFNRTRSNSDSLQLHKKSLELRRVCVRIDHSR